MRCTNHGGRKPQSFKRRNSALPANRRWAGRQQPKPTRGRAMSAHRAWQAWLLAVLWLAAVGGSAGQSNSAGAIGERRWPPPDENPQFFPTEAFGNSQNVLARFYSWYLRSMGEKPLPELVTLDHRQVYRALVVLRPYNAPVVVRMSVAKDCRGDLAAKVAVSGGHPELLTVNRTSEVSQANVRKFLDLMMGADFWSIPTLKLFNSRPSVLGESGWMLEGSKDGTYHVVVSSTSELGPLKGALQVLVVSLASLDLRSLPVGPARPH